MNYGIQLVGYGRSRRYVRRKVFQNGTAPLNDEIYDSEGQARRAAAVLGDGKRVWQLMFCGLWHR